MIHLRRACSTLVITVLASCRHSHAAARNDPPSAEFLVSGGDSTYWVATGSAVNRIRGAPLLLARYGGRFFELYVADDDLSFRDALLLGERLYCRDIMSGDSLVVFADTVVRRVADSYARAHPDEQPLAPNEEGEADPSTSATAEVDVLNVLGPYVSYEYHVDIVLPRARPFHSTRRGVIDLRSGKPVTVADVFGDRAAAKIEASGGQSFAEMRDSVAAARATLRGDERRAADALLQLDFDAHSFTLTATNDTLAVGFAVPGAGHGAAGNVVELDPIAVAPRPTWWDDVRTTLPTTDDEGNDRWTRSRYSVLARYDTSGEVARLSIADSARREWPLVDVSAPLHRIDWLDRPAIAESDRRALVRAFDAAASYDENARIAALPIRPHAYSPIRPTHASFEDRQRKPARNVRAHDARARQQPGSRVRRRHSVDDGQVCRDRRVSTQPRVGGHRLDRSRRFSRADSPRRSRRDESQRELRRPHVDGSRCAR